MGDAEIIPIGTRGRPGRGTNQLKPSSAARNLAGPGAKKVTPPRKKPPVEARPPSEPVDEPVEARDRHRARGDGRRHLGHHRRRAHSRHPGLRLAGRR